MLSKDSQFANMRIVILGRVGSFQWDDAAGNRLDGSLGAIGGFELVQDVTDVDADGAFTGAKHPGDLPIAQTLGDEA